MKKSNKFLLTSLVVVLGTTVLAENYKAEITEGKKSTKKITENNGAEQNFEDSLKNLKITLTKEEQKAFNFSQRITDCQKKSEQNDYSAMFELATYYSIGVLGKKDYNKTIELLNIIIEKSSNKVLKGKVFNKLGYMMMAGQGFRRSNTEAANDAERALKLGNVEAYGLLSQTCIYKLNNSQRDDKKALEFLKKGIKANSSESFFYLAKAYQSGQIGLKKDLKKSFEYYTTAADLDNPEALFIVGWSVLDGNYLAKKVTKQEGFDRAFNYIKRAIELDPCQITTLLQFAKDLDKKEKIKIVDFLKQLIKIDNKNLIALRTLAKIYKSDYVNMQNFKEYVAIIEYSLKHNPKNIELNKELAEIYGSGVIFGNRGNNGGLGDGAKTEFTNAKKAFKIYKKLADNYNICNIVVARYLLFNVDGVIQDDKKGIYYLQRGIKADSDNIMTVLNSLFNVYDYGMNMYSNNLPPEMIKKIANELLNNDNTYARIIAYKLFAQMYYNGNGFEKNYTKFIEYVKKAQVEGDSMANFVLSYCYLNEIGVKKDNTKVREYIIEYIKTASWNNWRLKQLIKAIAKKDNSILPKIIKEIKIQANKGNTVAMQLESYCYKEGYGVNKDLKKAQEILISYLKQSDNKNKKRDIMNLIIENYKHNSNTKKKFFTWLEKAYEDRKGSDDHLDDYVGDLIRCYLMGYGTKVNVLKALEILDEFSKKNKRLPYNLNITYIAMIYALGTNGQKQNLPKAIELMEKYHKIQGGDDSFCPNLHSGKMLLNLLKEKLAEQNNQKK